MFVVLVHLQLLEGGEGNIALVAFPLICLGITVRVKDPFAYLVLFRPVVVQYRVVVHPVFYGTHSSRKFSMLMI